MCSAFTTRICAAAAIMVGSLSHPACAQSITDKMNSWLFGPPAQDNAAKPFGAKFADGYGLFKLASSQAGGSACVAGLLTQFGGKAGSCGVHPSYAGGALLAQALAKVVRLH